MVKPRLEVRWAESAKEQFRESLTHLRKESPTAADKVKKKVFAVIGQISINPLMFEAHDFYPGKEYRSFVVYSYRVIYRVAGSIIYIIRVRHTSRDPLGLG